MCYSNFGNGVLDGAISITQWGFLNDHYKVNPIWYNEVCISVGENAGYRKCGCACFRTVVFTDLSG